MTNRVSRRLALMLAACLLPSGLALATEPGKLPVVATTSVLADFVAVTGGDRVEVKSLVGPNGDAHVYAPTPADAKSLAGAKLVVVNGLGLEGWIDRLIKASGTHAPVTIATKGVEPRQMDGEEGEAKGKRITDPHAWQSVSHAKLYVANIRDALIAADPAGADVYRANADAYLAKLEALDRRTQAAFAALSVERRRVITTHDAFGYFGAAYGIEFIAPQGISTEAEAGAMRIGKLIRQIKAEKIRAVFIENMTDPRLINRIAKETGVTPGGVLFSDALSPANGPAATYIEMIDHNTKLLTAAMAGS